MIELPLDMRRAVGVAQLMRRELEAVSFCKSLHLRHRHHRATGAAQTTTWVLSISTRLGDAPKYRSASVRKTLQSKRVKVG